MQMGYFDTVSNCFPKWLFKIGMHALYVHRLQVTRAVSFWETSHDYRFLQSNLAWSVFQTTMSYRAVHANRRVSIPYCILLHCSLLNLAFFKSQQQELSLLLLDTLYNDCRCLTPALHYQCRSAREVHWSSALFLISQRRHSVGIVVDSLPCPPLILGKQIIITSYSIVDMQLFKLLQFSSINSTPALLNCQWAWGFKMQI